MPHRNGRTALNPGKRGCRQECSWTGVISTTEMDEPALIAHVPGIGTPVLGRSKCGGLEAVRPPARLYELQAQTPASKRALSTRSSAQLFRTSVHPSGSIRPGSHEPLPASAGTEQAADRAARRAAELLSPEARYSKLSVERFRALPKYRDRPAAADMAFCISALPLEMPEDAIMRALEDDYLSRARILQRGPPTFGARLQKLRSGPSLKIKISPSVCRGKSNRADT